MSLLFRRPVVLALLAGAGLLVFHNTFGNSFHYDDEHSICQNPHLRSLTSIPRFFADPGSFSALPEARMYRPLLLVSFALNYALGGYAVWGYHLVNLLLHLANAYLVWELGRLLLRRPGMALAVALLFALHPLASEPVNYISSRSVLLVCLFYLLAFLVLVRGADSGGRPLHLLLVGLGYLAALASKESAVVFPLAGGLYLGLVARRPAWRPAWRLLLLPVLLTPLYLAGMRGLAGKALLAPVRPLLVQWATQVKAAVLYLGTAILPVRLSVEPQFFTAAGWAAPAVLLAGAFLASLAAAGLAGRRQQRLLVFGAAWFGLNLLPEAAVPLHVLVNEHRLYLPLVGALVGTGALLEQSRLTSRAWLLVALVALGSATWQRNRVWKSEQTLWADAAAKGPGMARPWVNLGRAYLEQGQYQEAIAASQQALAIDPALARAYYNIGTAYLHQDKGEEAVVMYQRALELQPDLLEAHNNLGNAYQELGRLEEAVQVYRRALTLAPQAQLCHNLGNAFLRQGRPDSAAAAFRRALGLDPDSQESYKGLIKACRAQGQAQEALAAAQEALRRWPREALFWGMLGDAEAALGQEEQAAAAYGQAGLGLPEVELRLGEEARRQRDWSRARHHYEEALRQGGDDARVWEALGQVEYSLGEVAGALEHFRQAARLDPGRASAYAHIGQACLEHGASQEAAAALERAVSLAPDQGDFWALLAQARTRQGELEPAIAAYQKAVRLAPEEARFYHNLGLLYQQQGHRTEAERMYQAALARDPRLARAWYNLGNLHLEQRRPAVAVDNYQQALALAPGDAEVYINLASAWLELGERGKALAAYERFLAGSAGEDSLRQRVLVQVEALRRGGR